MLSVLYKPLTYVVCEAVDSIWLYRSKNAMEVGSPEKAPL